MPPWFLGYALLGATQSGMAPILLPLSGEYGGSLYSAWAAAGLLAPALGHWSDRRQQHHRLAVGGLALFALSMLAFQFVAGLPAHLALAFLGGVGAVAASTMGTMFIVGAMPREMWDEHIGRLQSCVSAGQVVGLLLAGVLAQMQFLAFSLQACVAALALPMIWRFAPTDPAPIVREQVTAHPAHGGEAGTHGTIRAHHVSLRGLASLTWLPHGKLRLFLAVWLVSYTATNGVCAMFPVALTREFGQPAILPAVAYAIGTLLSLPLYATAAHWERRSSARTVLVAGLVSRGAVLGGMAVLTYAKPGWAILPILAAFAMTQILWPLLGVSSTTLAVELASLERGESVGLLNACSALGAMLGGVVGGQINARLGFGVLCAVACACVLLSLVLPRVHPASRRVATP